MPKRQANARSFQFGRASAPMAPHTVQTIRRPSDSETSSPNSRLKENIWEPKDIDPCRIRCTTIGMGKFLLRNVEPELADHIPGDDPRALRFRRDLSRLNALTMTDRVMARTLLKHWGSRGSSRNSRPRCRRRYIHAARCPKTCTEMARCDSEAGRSAGYCGRSCSRRLCRGNWNIQTVPADVFEFLQKMQLNVDIVIANGFLHHFTAERLTRLLSLAAGRAKLIVAGEPRRTHFAREVSRFVWLLG